jgi:hypothetical protein
MNEPMNKLDGMHLTEDQIDDALIGDLGAPAAAHLKACAACAARMAEAEMPLASFKTVSTAWSERRSATMPAIAPLRTGLGARGRLMAWSAALSVMIVAGVVVPVALHQRTGESATAARPVQVVATLGASGATASTGVAAASGSMASNAGASSRQSTVDDRSSQDRISQDNAMLMDIDRELDATTSAPAALTLEGPHGPLAKPQPVNE